MEIEYECTISKNGYKWASGKLDGKDYLYLVPKNSKTKKVPLPDDAYTETCKLGWNLKKDINPDIKANMIYWHVMKYGSLEGIEGDQRLTYYMGVEVDSSTDSGFPISFPSVENYTEFCVSLYEQRLDMVEGLPRYAIERNIDAEVRDQMSVVKRVVGKKIELFLKPYLLKTAIDLQFIMNQGMVGQYKVCEYCNKPFTASRSDARFCPENSTCKVNHFRSKK